ncbi:lamin tail domain-containing protein [Lewinella sp. LCG006]|uniref:lamin tail domain-containing protein n=1 Tax=Lewinella sp. LCG006 TaxID=3231911 RepID=UPI0034612E00
MRTFTIFLMCLVGAITLNAQTPDLVISEIMYNPPESGVDTYEYLEIYNNGTTAVDLLGYSLSGVDYVFTSGLNLGAGEYLLFAGDSIAFEAAFGLAALQWTGGSLSNGGELLKLLDATGAVVDSVDFDDSFPWPTAADGGGASLVLCDFNSDNNDGANWAAANTGTGVLSEGVEMFGNPGAASACPTGPIVRFLTDQIEVGEDAGTFTIGVEIRDAEAGTYSVDIAADGVFTATIGADITFLPASLTFSSGAAVDTMEVSITVIDDTDPEPLESLVLNLANPTGGLTISGVASTSTILIADNDTDIPAIVINEIMYSPPGTDSQYEYLELFNNDDVVINVGGYYFSAGIVDTLPDVDLQPGDFLLLAVDSVSFEATYGLPAFQWESGSLSNAGETIELRDALGNVVDVVSYDDTNGWPAAANGDGPALVLCDPSSDNELAASWIAGVQPTGVFISGIEILGSPGAANDCTPPAPQGYTPYAIGQVTGINATGVADSLGVRAELTGIVYGGNLRPGGAQFTIIDGAGDGIAMFSNDNDFGYTVTEGDEVTVQGVVSQFNGLTQLNLDTILMNSMNNSLLPATEVTALGEDTESQLVSLTGVTIVDFATAGGGLNVNVTDGTNTFLVRVDFDTNITEADISGFGDSPLMITGLGGQFDSSEPYDEGYQLLPRYLDDIQIIDATNEPAWAQYVELFPNPTANQLTIRNSVVMEQLSLKNKLGQTLRTWNVSGEQSSIDLAALPAGVYFLQIQAAGEQLVRRIVKQ